MICWAFPFKGVSRKTIGVLLSGGLFLLGDEENDFVVVSRCNYATRDGVETSVAPQLGKRLARVSGTLRDFGK